MLVACLLAASASAGSPSAPAGEFAIRIEWSILPTSLRRVYSVSPREVVVEESDEGGSHRVFHGRLKSDEARALHSLMEQLPLESLKSEYVLPGVEDGDRLDFELQLGTRPAKRVRLSNQWQADLARLCRRINESIPGKLAIPAPPARSS